MSRLQTTQAVVFTSGYRSANPHSSHFHGHTVDIQPANNRRDFFANVQLALEIMSIEPGSNPEVHRNYPSSVEGYHVHWHLKSRNSRSRGALEGAEYVGTVIYRDSENRIPTDIKEGVTVGPTYSGGASWAPRVVSYSPARSYAAENDQSVLRESEDATAQKLSDTVGMGGEYVVEDAPPSSLSSSHIDRYIGGLKRWVTTVSCEDEVMMPPQLARQFDHIRREHEHHPRGWHYLASAGVARYTAENLVAWACRRSARPYAPRSFGGKALTLQPAPGTENHDYAVVAWSGEYRVSFASAVDWKKHRLPIAWTPIAATLVEESDKWSALIPSYDAHTLSLMLEQGWWSFFVQAGLSVSMNPREMARVYAPSRTGNVITRSTPDPEVGIPTAVYRWHDVNTVVNPGSSADLDQFKVPARLVGPWSRGVELYRGISYTQGRNELVINELSP